jgi:hypothetical protein
MDEFSKSGPKLYAAEARRREPERLRTVTEGLALLDESDFIVFLRDRLGVRPGDPGYLPAIKLWRAKHS